MIKEVNGKFVDEVGGANGPEQKPFKPHASWPVEGVQVLLAIGKQCRGKETIAKARAQLAPGQHMVAQTGKGIPITCGYDVNKLILLEAADGEEHGTECPNCGATITWRPAKYVEPASA